MRRSVVAVSAAGAIAVGVATTILVAVGPGHSDPARAVAAEYLAAWAQDKPATMASLLDAPAPDAAAMTTDLIDGNPARFALVSWHDHVATYRAHVDVGGFGPVEWTSRLPVVKVAERWRVHWQSDDAYPGLSAGQRVVLRRIWPRRAPILGDDGTPLVATSDAKIVGLEPDRITNLGQVQSVLATTLHVDPSAVSAALNGPGVKPNYFVSITTVRPEQLMSLRPTLEPVPGIFFRNTTARLAVVDGLAPQVLGTVGDITADRLHALGAPYRVGDQVGLSGLEGVYERRLAGHPTPPSRSTMATATRPASSTVMTGRRPSRSRSRWTYAHRKRPKPRSPGSHSRRRWSPSILGRGTFVPSSAHRPMLRSTGRSTAATRLGRLSK